jgi:hypothetical protein
LIGRVPPHAYFTMQILMELSRLVSVDRLKSAGLYVALFEPGSKLELLFELIELGKVKTDQEAISIIYGDGDKPTKFINLKKRLRERLIRAIALLEIRKEDEHATRSEVYVACHRRWANLVLLWMKNAHLTIVEEQENLLKDAELFEFTDLALLITSQLKLYYGTIRGDSDKYERFSKANEHYVAMYMAENHIEGLYTDLVRLFVHKKLSNDTIINQARQAYEQSRNALSRYDTFRIQLSGRLIQILYFNSLNNFKSAAQVCQQGIDYFTEKPYNSQLPFSVFYNQLILCALRLVDFEMGQQASEGYKRYFQVGSFNWFKYQELVFILSLHTRQYKAAADIQAMVLPELKRHKPPAQITEMWHVLEAYLFLLLKMGKVEAANSEAHFRIGKFINEVPVYIKDKGGMNIPILIIQILFLLYERDYNTAIDRIEAIEKYCSRYLQKDDTFRSNCMIKMLLQIPIASFHKAGAERRAAKYLDLLRTNPFSQSNQPHEVELIPYEDLWSMALELLDNKIVRVRSKKVI